MFALWILLGFAGGFAVAAYVFALGRKARARRLVQAVDARDYAEALIDRSPDGFIVVGDDMTILRVNDAYCRITGRSSKDLVGRRPPFPGWAPEEQEKIEARIEATKHGDFQPVEFSYLRPDGGRVPVEFNPGSVVTKDGRTHYFAVVKDLAATKRREEKLRESEENFRRIAETSVDAIYQLDPSGKLVYCSPAVQRIGGYTQEEFIGTDFRSHIAPEDLRTAEITFIRNLGGEEIKNAELHLLRKDGKKICIEVNATPVRKGDSIIGVQGMARDITQRKRIEESLRASEARLRTVIDNIPFDFFYIDENGRYAMQNKTIQKTWGWDLIGRRPEDMDVGEETRAKWLDNNRRAFAGETVEEDVVFNIRGEERRFRNIIAPVREGGRVLGILGLNIDVTEQKRAELALRESEEKYRFLVENTGTAVSLWDRDGRLLLINSMGARNLGGAAEDLVGRSLGDLFSQGITDQGLTRFKNVLETGVGSHYETEVALPTGGTRWFRSYMQPVKNMEGQIFGVQIVSHDITQLTQAERSLRERDARLRLMVSQLPAIVWTVDRELRFTSSAGAGLTALGLAPGQVVGRSLYEYFGSQDPEFLPIAMHRRSLEGKAATFELMWDGSIWETYTEPLRSEKGEIIGCLAIALDVTKRRRAEEDLKKSKEELRALAGKLQTVREEESTSIAREIHDELGQALTGIKYDLGYIERRLSFCDEADARSDVEKKIQEMNEQIDATINTVRKISTQLRPKILDDLDLAGAIEWQAQDFQRRSGVICNVNSYCSSSELALDPSLSTAVFRIFQEILTNIRRHAEARHVYVDLRCEGEALLLEVRDDGKGIPKAQLHRPGGLGILGMRERALVFGGEVVIDSEPGKGTAVTVKIPLRETA